MLKAQYTMQLQIFLTFEDAVQWVRKFACAYYRKIYSCIT